MRIPAVEVHWRDLTDDADRGWDQRRCLYAYFTPGNELLYIGKAWGKTVYERWCRGAKEPFWDDLERERGLFRHRPAVGTIALVPGCRLTRELLADIESLLIHRMQPWGNIQGRYTRIEREGLAVACRGTAWSLSRRSFRDDLQASDGARKSRHARAGS